jgi:serine/threonine protein kinase/tetratricopeptide (TPR) repeat protein
MTDPSSQPDLLARLAEEFAQRYRRGERPCLSAYADRHPELAADIRELFPALVALEELGPAAGPGAAPDPGAPAGPGAVPERLGDFRILREVGRGGMGVVYEAVQLSLARRVALKVLPFAATMDPRQLQRFQNEARAAACLHHDHIVPVHAVGSESGVHYFAMQFIEGQTLEALLRAKRRELAPASEPLAVTPPRGDDATADDPVGGAPGSPAGPPEGAAETRQPDRSPLSVTGPAYFRRIAAWGAEAAEALEHAHQLGIVHRDIKPGNLMIGRQGKLWVTDFGLARRPTDLGLTMTGDLLGTLRYMSPEQALARHGLVDHRTDVYALGVTLYELLTLQPAINGKDRQEVLNRIAFDEPPAPRALDRTIPADLDTIVRKAMQKDPDGRYATAGDLAEDLRRFLADRPIRARPPTRRQRVQRWVRRHRRGVTAAAAALFLAALALAGIAGWVLQERAGRLARTEEKVREALQESDERQARAEIPEALEAVARAEAAVAAGGGDETLRARVAARRRDLEMVLRLEGVIADPEYWDQGLEYHNAHHDRILSRLFAQVFRDHGIDVEKLDTAEAAKRLRATTVWVEGAAALDLWAQLMTSSGRDNGPSKRLLAIAVAADPDPLRVRVRQALARYDLPALTRLAADSPAEGLPPSTAILLGRVLVAAGRDRAGPGLEVMRRAQRQHPGHFWLNHTLAHGLETAQPKRWQEDAIRFASAALAARPTGTGGYSASQLLGSAFREKGDLSEAAAAYRRAVALRPGSAAAHLNIGVVLRAQGKLEQAAGAFRKATQVKPDDYVAHDALGGLRESQKRYAEAEEAYQRAIQVRPDFGPSHVHLAELRLKVGDPAGALRACARAIRHAPDFGLAYQTRARAHQELGQLHQAEAAFRKAIKVRHGMSPRYRATMRVEGGGHFLARAHCELGAFLQAQQRLDEAADEHRKAIAQDRGFAQAHAQLGGIYLQQEKPLEAIKLLDTALALDKDHSGAHFELGRAYKKLGKLESAAAHYRRAAELKPYQFWADIELGLIRKGQRKLPAAEAAFRRAVTRLRELSRESRKVKYRSALGAALNNLAKMLSERGDPAEARVLLTEAIPHQQAALKARPKDPDVRAFLRNHYMHLANANVQLRDHRGAAAAAAELVRLYPDGWQEHVRAAGYLARCAELAAQDEALSAGQRTEAARGYGDRAVVLLRQAAEQGYRDAAALRRPPFEPLRDRADFRQLLSTLGGSATP